MKTLILMMGALACAGVAGAQYEATEVSLAKHEAAPEWLQDAKLGIYFHWAPFSVAAFGGAWYPAGIYREGDYQQTYHEKTFGPVETHGYDWLITQFKAEQYDPAEWAQLFKESGARFAGGVAQHHDGFAMWHSKVNPWNAGDMGPKRDIIGDLFTELKKQDLKTIATLHHARNGQRNQERPELWGAKSWKDAFNTHYPYHPDSPVATTDPKLRKLFGNFETIEEFNAYWLAQTKEVVDFYSPDILWYDSWFNMIPREMRYEATAHYFNHAAKTGQEVVTCHKHNDMPMSFSVLDFEQGGRRDTHPMPWMTDITLSKGGTWSYVKGQKTKPASMVIRNMIDVWSKNGIVLLNIAPRGDGVIEDDQRAMLAEIGEWLQVHGEAVYGTRPYDTYGFGTAGAKASSHDGQSAKTEYTAEDVRFTISKDQKAIYVFLLGQPEQGAKVVLRPLAAHRYCPPTPIKRATLLGCGSKVESNDDTYAINLIMPNVAMNELATVVKLELE